MKHNNQKYISAIVKSETFFLIFLIIVFLVKFVDVQAIGPQNSEVGMATINGLFRDLIGVHEKLYKITELLGMVAIATALIFALVGLYQMVTRKSLKKVDTNIILLGIFYVVVIGCYIFFEIFIVNYRPVILESELEASFPSSHTMLAVSLFGATIYQIAVRIKNKFVKGFLIFVCSLLMIATVGGRLISGVHWFTDILGGIALSGALIFAYVAACEKRALKNEKNRGITS